MKLMEIIPLFDRYLGDRETAFEAIVVGGTALALLGIIARETRDCDVVEPNLPKAILQASRAFAKHLCDRGTDLTDCIALQPTAEELGVAASWLVQQDLHLEWPIHVHSILDDLARRLGHGI